MNCVAKGSSHRASYDLKRTSWNRLHRSWGHGSCIASSTLNCCPKERGPNVYSVQSARIQVFKYLGPKCVTYTYFGLFGSRKGLSSNAVHPEGRQSNEDGGSPHIAGAGRLLQCPASRAGGPTPVVSEAWPFPWRPPSWGFSLNGCNMGPGGCGMYKIMDLLILTSYSLCYGFPVQTAFWGCPTLRL